MKLYLSTNTAKQTTWKFPVVYNNKYLFVGHDFVGLLAKLCFVYLIFLLGLVGYIMHVLIAVAQM